MKKVFLSYSKDNLERAKALLEDLEALGNDVWLDQDLTGGQTWWNEILRTIRDSEIFLVALSTESLASAACQRELAYASNLNKTILPVIVTDGVSIDLLPEPLGRLQLVDYRQSDKQAVVQLAKTISVLPASPPLPEPLPDPPAVPMSPLGSLREQIETSSVLKFEEQTAIVLKMRKALRDAKKPDDVRSLLVAFRTREDLLARVADEIDELLGGRATASGASPTPDTARARKQAAIDLDSRSSASTIAPLHASQPSSPVLKGIDDLLSRVRICFGPGKRTVIVPRGADDPLVTTSAAEVLSAFQASSPAEAVGARMIQSAAAAIFDAVGSGGPTTALLAQAIYKSGLLALAAQPNASRVTKSIESASQACTEQLKTLTRRFDAKTLAGVANVAGDDELKAAIVAAFEKVGLDGTVVVEEHRGLHSELSVVEGMQFDRGYLSADFVTDVERMQVVLERPSILFHQKQIVNRRDLLPLLEKVAAAGRSLLIIAEDVAGEVLETLITNKVRNTLKVAAVKAPGFGDRRKAMLEDMAILTGGRAITEDVGIKLDAVQLEDLGHARRIVADAEMTVIVDGAGNESDIQARVKTLQRDIEATTSEYDREKMQERLAKLVGGVAVISIGAHTEPQRTQRRRTVETALRSVRAASDEGVVIGGGVALLRAAAQAHGAATDALSLIGSDILRRACEEPVRQLAINAGEDPDQVVAEVLKGADVSGFNAETGEITDLFAAGVVDPAKGARVALASATATAVKLLWSTMVS